MRWKTWWRLGYIVDRVTFKLLEIIQRIWREEGFLKSWRKGVIVPIYKKGDKDKAANYHGITLLNTAYKIYTMILEERLRQELDKNKFCFIALIAFLIISLICLSIPSFLCNAYPKYLKWYFLYLFRFKAIILFFFFFFSFFWKLLFSLFFFYAED